MSQATHMLPRDVQLSNEHTYSKRAIDGYIDMELRANPDMEARVQRGIALLQDWSSKTYYASKDARIAQLSGMDIEEVVRKVFINVAYCQIPELFTSVTGQLAGTLKMSEKADGIVTIGEMLAVLCLTDAFDIIKTSSEASLKVQSQIPISERLINYVSQSRYLPPMVCEPEPVENNHQSPYLTFNDYLVLGKGNSHSEDICLDVINTQNAIPMALNLEFLSTVEEDPSDPITLDSVRAAARKKDPNRKEARIVQDYYRQLEQWAKFKRQSYELYHLMAKQGNRFHFHHKVDKRGRLYAQGYHISPQGSSHKKAMLDFADKEVVTGVPA